jgi:hypothetical protein
VCRGAINAAVDDHRAGLPKTGTVEELVERLVEADQK